MYCGATRRVLLRLRTLPYPWVKRHRHAYLFPICGDGNEQLDVLEAPIKFSPSQLRQAWEALLDSFDYPNLEQLLYFRFGKDLAAITPANANFSDICFNLVRRAEREGWLDDLILAAADARPTNAKLEQLARDLRVETASADSTGRQAPDAGPETGYSVGKPETDPHQTDAPADRSVFISYSHKDERYRRELEISLAQLQRDNLVTVWHDRKILPGQEWGQEIDRNLESAEIVLLLVSPDFLASNYAYGREMLRAMERHRSRSATVVPIILRPSDWQHTPISSLQALPSEGRPVSRWSNRDQAWLDVVQGLRRLISRQR